MSSGINNNYVKENLLTSHCANSVMMHSIKVEKDTADSGCSDHYASMNADVKNTQPAGNNAVSVTLPDGNIIKSIHSAIINNKNLPRQARKCHLFSGMKNKVLISLGELCDCGMKISLNKNEILIHEDNKASKLVMKGERSKYNGMWYLNLNQEENQHAQQANNVNELRKQKNVVDFLSLAMWKPVPETWIEAINASFFAIWPGLTAENARKNYEKQLNQPKGT